MTPETKEQIMQAARYELHEIEDMLAGYEDPPPMEWVTASDYDALLVKYEAKCGITIDMAGAMEKLTPEMLDHTRDIMIDALMSKVKELEAAMVQGTAQAGALAELDKAATPGMWGQYGLYSGPWQEQAKEAYATKKFKNIDTSHHMSAVNNGVPKRLAEFTHADDAAFAEALVNAYRAGRLVVAEPQEGATA